MEEIDDLWSAHTDRTLPFDRRFGGSDRRSSRCIFDHGVACGADRSGTHDDHRKSMRVARAPLLAAGAQEAMNFVLRALAPCPLWIISRT